MSAHQPLALFHALVLSCRANSLINNKGSPLSLLCLIVTQSNLPNGSVLAKEVVQVAACCLVGDVLDEEDA